MTVLERVKRNQRRQAFKEKITDTSMYNDSDVITVARRTHLKRVDKTTLRNTEMLSTNFNLKGIAYVIKYFQVLGSYLVFN